MGQVLSVQEITKILPHRYPFLLVDRVLEKTDGPSADSRVGSKVKALKNVSIGEPFFVGHFPNKPVMPGVMILEAMAQAGALAYFSGVDKEVDVAIAAVNSAKFRKPVVPGDSLIMDVEIVKDRKSMVLIRCMASVGGEKVAEADILASIGSNK